MLIHNNSFSQSIAEMNTDTTIYSNEILLKEASIYFKSDESKAKQYAENILRDTLAANNIKAEAYNILGKIAYHAYKYNDAKEFFIQGRNLSIEDTTRYKLLVNLALTHSKLHDYSSSEKLYNQALRYVEYDSSEIAFIYKQTGKIYKKQKEYAEAIRFFEKALKFVPQNNPKTKAEIQTLTGNCYYFEKAYEKARIAYQKAFLLYQPANDSIGMIRSLLNVSLSYQSENNFSHATQLLKKILEFCHATNNEQLVATALSQSAQIFTELKQYDKAIANYNDALQVFQKNGDSLSYYRTLANKASTLKKMGHFDEALHLYLKALDMQSALEIPIEEKALVLTNIGETNQLLGNYEATISFFTNALELYQQVNDADGQARLLYYNGKQLLVTGNYIAAEQQLKQSLRIAGKMKNNELLRSLYLTLANLYKTTENWKESSKYFEKHQLLYDSLFQLDMHKQLIEVQTLYETEKKRHKIEKLALQQRLQKTEILKQKRLKQIYTIAFFVTLVLSFLVITQYLRKNNAYKTLVKKNNELVNLQQTVWESKLLINNAMNMDNTETKNRKTIMNELDEIMKQDKIYLDKNLTINKVSKLLATNRTYLSQEIKAHCNCNFNEYVKKHRIDEALHLLSDADYANLTIEAIATKVGFNSKSTFNYAFKKITGVTPSYYREHTFADAVT